jgi:hypothetical protein
VKGIDGNTNGSNYWGESVFFYSNEGDEPPHVHVKREKCSAKFWLRPVVLVYTSGFKGAELRKLERIINQNSTRFMEAWDAYFKN